MHVDDDQIRTVLMQDFGLKEEASHIYCSRLQRKN